MKTFMVTYTVDFGETYHTILVSADTFTAAYVDADMTIPKDGAITDLFEVS